MKDCAELIQSVSGITHAAKAPFNKHNSKQKSRDMFSCIVKIAILRYLFITLLVHIFNANGNSEQNDNYYQLKIMI